VSVMCRPICRECSSKVSDRDMPYFLAKGRCESCKRYDEQIYNDDIEDFALEEEQWGEKKEKIGGCGNVRPKCQCGKRIYVMKLPFFLAKGMCEDCFNDPFLPDFKQFLTREASK